MQRRTYLATAGSTALACLTGLAGCASVPSGGPGDTDGTATGSGDDDPSGGVHVETVAEGLRVPWGVAYRDGDLYVTERPGRIVRVGDDGSVDTVVESIPDLGPRGEGGLLGLAFHPTEPTAYSYQTYNSADGLANRVVRHDLDDSWRQEPILDGIPASSIHDGGRLMVHDDSLFVTCGDAGTRSLAQEIDSLAGKVHRLTLDGEAHPDNPFGNTVFTYGHRNPQGLAVRDGELFSTEHGPSTDDEINVLVAGDNYGWPEVKGPSENDEYTDPLTSYTPTIAPGGATFYDGPITAWQGDFLFGTLSGTYLHRVRFDGHTVVEQERLYGGEFGRLRTTVTDPDGHLLVTTSNRDGRGRPRDGDDKILRFRPAEQ